MELTQRLGAAIGALRDTDIPVGAADIMRRGLSDCVGVLIAGSAEPVVQRARAALAPLGPAEARLLPSGERCSARNAALLNGIASHVLDYDDVAMDGHPSAVLFAALLAEAEVLGATGRDLLRGYVAGYETWAALWAACAEPLHSRAWHPTGVFGPLAAAAGCAALHRLSERQATNALGLAAAQSAGLIANFGTMAKSFQLGRAAEAGLLAARLARAGVDASGSIIEDKAGFLRAFAGASRPRQLGFGQPDWAILTEGLDIKIYPVCYATHRVVDAALQLARDEAPDIAEIERVELCLGHLQSEMLHSHEPKTVLAAKFSAEFAAAAALIAKCLTLSEMCEEFLAQPALQALIARSTRTLDPVLAEPPFSAADQVILHGRDGSVRASRPVRHASGSRHRPPTREEAYGKFQAAVGRHWPAGRAERSFDRLWRLDLDLPIGALLDICCMPGFTHQ
jgi:2-methylcitrate dehydratase PrpD